MNTCRKFCAARHSELGYPQPPGVGFTEDEWHHYRGQRLLSLLPGDDGYVAWIAAQNAFVEGTRTAFTPCYGGGIDCGRRSSLARAQPPFPDIAPFFGGQRLRPFVRGRQRPVLKWEPPKGLEW
ncbi:uncharacterized protein NFIA_087230 [Aspergillus fischeri NRRL 181]|uniref:Uncharacterized protein n=1 Tax=Neosartorya fischeri (strain ATCC 1020 / DSM 3700 / CBS 544.65 / FGSC A1164 / JCM 1740 / NRRL 181 / WB 181) TaxID=331117 RepID=A1DHB0_NEOFI|nr:uncharacterized protein NFIA_087230 [Aspergillus fischeri NRRL 181]EAW18767.1 hypothetical protein NFIA_087230 [Aspergillus fischeri NRRL 181]